MIGRVAGYLQGIVQSDWDFTPWLCLACRVDVLSQDAEGPLEELSPAALKRAHENAQSAARVAARCVQCL